ncbi:MAG: 3D domain-containing protein [Firmicutes bacterium]|nr:3D domain-containing protein [Bacillota bacterium]
MQAYTSPGRFLGDNRLIIWCLGVVVAAGIIITGFFYNRHEIRIYADGKEIKLIMRGGTFAGAVKKAGIPLGEKDIVEPPLQNSITADSTVRITRIVRVNLIADGNTEVHWVPLGTVEQTLNKLNVVLNSGDQVVPELSKRVSSGDAIEVIRFSSHYLSQSLKIPFRVERRDDNSLERGITRIVRQGQEGLIQKTVKITLKNGKEINREVLGRKVLREPVNKIVAVGTIRVKEVSRGGNIRFSKTFYMSSTAYSHTGHNTASGIYPYRGAVAVDPGVIPLGTKLFIEGYGYAKALDIGSAIRGNRIDLFFDTEGQALRWGRRSVKVYILE